MMVGVSVRHIISSITRLCPPHPSSLGANLKASKNSRLTLKPPTVGMIWVSPVPKGSHTELQATGKRATILALVQRGRCRKKGQERVSVK